MRLADVTKNIFHARHTATAPTTKEGCLNPFTKTVESVATNTGGVDQDDSEDMDQDDDIDCPDDVDYHENYYEDENKDESTESDFITDDEWD